MFDADPLVLLPERELILALFRLRTRGPTGAEFRSRVPDNADQRRTDGAMMSPVRQPESLRPLRSRGSEPVKPAGAALDFAGAGRWASSVVSRLCSW